MNRRTARVFTADNGAHGNEVAVVLVDRMPAPSERQRLATAAAEPATVFVAKDLRTVRIHNRLLERRFAGHPLLGTAAVLRSLGMRRRRSPPLPGMSRCGPRTAPNGCSLQRSGRRMRPRFGDPGSGRGQAWGSVCGDCSRLSTAVMKGALPAR
ncbi:PhzF family phenazine biosynthesis protein [Kribbella italica]|uniref:PhzF family phenazine biosynthesis protein n=1 Tax=Kribbella italica TaxID=1540520 RepID=UPI00161BC996